MKVLTSPSSSLIDRLEEVKIVSPQNGKDGGITITKMLFLFGQEIPPAGEKINLGNFLKNRRPKRKILQFGFF